MGKDFAGFAMGENPGSIGGVHFFAIVAAIGAGADAAADCFPAFVVTAVLAGLDAGEGVGNLVKNGVEDFFFGIESGKRPADGDFFFSGAADAKASLGVVQSTCPTTLSKPVFGELALQKVEGLVGIHGPSSFLQMGLKEKSPPWQWKGSHARSFSRNRLTCSFSSSLYVFAS